MNKNEREREKRGKHTFINVSSFIFIRYYVNTFFVFSILKSRNILILKREKINRLDKHANSLNNSKSIYDKRKKIETIYNRYKSFIDIRKEKKNN